MEENNNISAEQAGRPPKQTTENIPEVEHIKNPTSAEETISSEENILPEIETAAIEQQPTANNQQTENMEVHHHAHDPAAPHHKKNWKNYFWEFLMLFLAVFCGFLAEYQLEHVIEHQREKQYIESLVADLKSDQEVLSTHIEHVKTGLSMMDSMINILNTPAQLKNNTANLYFFARLAPRLSPLSTNNRTFEQLKNSGNFRLIRNLNTSNKIMTYYEKFPLTRLLESVNETEFTEYKKAAAKIFDPMLFLNSEGLNDEIKRLNYNPALRTTDNELLREFSIFAVYMHGTKKGMLTNDEILKITGAELIEYLQKEYHLE